MSHYLAVDLGTTGCRSILFDAKADCISYGMGERSIVELAKALRMGKDISHTAINGCCYVKKEIPPSLDCIEIPSFEEVSQNKNLYA